jgi:hypothetical protein
MQLYTVVFITINALHVSWGSSAHNQELKTVYTASGITINAVYVSCGSSTHHQELKTVYTASGICRAFSASYRYRERVQQF